MEVQDIIEVSIFVTALIGYHPFFLYLLITSPARVSLGLNIAEREAWVKRNLSTKNSELLVVHSFRNMILGTTFLSNSSLLIAWGFLKPLLKTEDPVAAAPRILFLAAIFFLAFISFAIAVRTYTHLTFVLTGFGDVSDTHLPNVHKSICSMMMRATVFFWLGMRCFYLALPIGLWNMGFPGLLVGTVMLLVILFYNDIYSH